MFVSPSLHQVHHSPEPRHVDKNFGNVLSLWDWMFGTLYVPRERERIHFGIAPDEAAELDGPLRLYYVPVLRAFARLRLRVRRSTPDLP